MNLLRKMILIFMLISSGILWSAANESTSFNLMLNKITPDYFRFVYNNGDSTSEIGTEGISFTIPDPVKNYSATATFAVEYDIRSNSILTLHVSSDRKWASSETGYMLVGEENNGSGLNYDLAWSGKSYINDKTSHIITDGEDRRKPINLKEYDVTIYSPSGNYSSSGIVDFILTMNPPVWDDGSSSYMSDIYTGYLTLSLKAL